MYRSLVFLAVATAGLFAAVTLHWPAQIWGSGIAFPLLALGLGNVLGGQLSVRAPSLQKLAALLLFMAWTGIPLLMVGDAVVGFLTNRIANPQLLGFTVNGALVFIPFLFAGMISPYGVRLLAADVDDSGRKAGAIHALVTFAAAAGTVLLSIVQIKLLGWTVSAVAVLTGLIALLSGRRLSRHRAI